MTTEVIWNQFSNKLFAFINSRTHNPSDSEDLLQEVFLKIHNNLDNLNNLNKVESWIFQITRNVVNDYFRKENKVSSLEEDPVDPATNEETLRVNIRECLTHLSEQLPEKYRVPIKEVYLDGRKQKDMALELGMSYSGMKSRIQRGRAMLMDTMKDCCNVQKPEDIHNCNC